jgi:hypothetical protein
MQVASFILSLIAIGISIAAAVYAKRSADAAHRSARADERSADVAERTNRRETQQERNAAEHRRAEAAERQVRWKVRHRDGDGARCRLDNLGTHDARGVRVSLPRGFDHPQFSRDLPTNAFIAAKEGVWFEVFALNRVDHVFVSWEGHRDAVRVDISGPAIIV